MELKLDSISVEQYKLTSNLVEPWFISYFTMGFKPTFTCNILTSPLYRANLSWILTPYSALRISLYSTWFIQRKLSWNLPFQPIQQSESLTRWIKVSFLPGTWLQNRKKLNLNVQCHECCKLFQRCSFLCSAWNINVLKMIFLFLEAWDERKSLKGKAMQHESSRRHHKVTAIWIKRCSFKMND